MPVGIAEMALLALLAFVAFGPRKPKAAGAASPGALVLAARAAAVVAPSVMLVDRVAAGAGLVGASRAWLVGASVAATAISLLILDGITRWTSPPKR